MRTLIAGFALLAASLVSAPSAAEGKLTASLSVERSPEAKRCIDGTELGKAVEERLGRAVFVADRKPDLKLGIHIDAAPEAGWKAQLVLEDSRGVELGRREIATTARDCSSLDASLALVVALLVDAPPEPPEEPPPPEPSAPPPPPRTPPPPTRITLPPDTHSPREPFRFYPGLSGILAIGLLPGLAPGGGVSFSVLPPGFVEFAVFGQFFAPRDATTGRGRGVDIRHFRVGLSVCPLAHETDLFRLAACAGQAVGRVDARAFGFDVSNRSRDLTYALHAGPVFRLRLFGPVGLRVAPSLDFPLTRNAYLAEPGKVRLYRTGTVSFVGEIGVSAEL